MRSDIIGQRTEDRGQIVVYRCAALRSFQGRGAAAGHTQAYPLRAPLSSERGSTLVISLIILIVLMLLGVMAMNTSDTQYKLAGNLQFEDVAMSNAEQAIDAAERWLESDTLMQQAIAVANNADVAPSTAVSAVSITPLTMTWTSSETPPNPPSVAVTGPDGAPNDRQRYVIGYVSRNRAALAQVGGCPDALRPFDCVHTYLITARGLGGRGATKFVQVYYSVPL